MLNYVGFSSQLLLEKNANNKNLPEEEENYTKNLKEFPWNRIITAGEVYVFANFFIVNIFMVNKKLLSCFFIHVTKNTLRSSVLPTSYLPGGYI